MRIMINKNFNLKIEDKKYKIFIYQKYMIVINVYKMNILRNSLNFNEL